MALSRFSFFAVAASFGFASCGENKEAFVGSNRKLSTLPSMANPVGEPIPTPTPSPAPDDEAHSESFTLAARQAPVDFLFVIDNSCSMNSYKERVLAGFRAIETNSYPAESRLGVMTTMPASVDNLAAVHPDVVDYPQMSREPGFLALSRQQAVRAFRNAMSTVPEANRPNAYSNAFPKPMCETGWFEPHAASPTQGVSCLEAAFQTVSHCTGVEAGLTAVKQLMQKGGSTPFFRPHAFVNVVFVSDVHDPGARSEALKAIRPDFAALRAAVMTNNPSLSGFKVHGVVPKTNCGEMANEALRAFVGFSYLPVIQASQGVSVDMCTQTDYTPVARQIVNANRVPKVFTLSKPASAVRTVTVSGTPTTDFSFEGRELTVFNLDPARENVVSVTYVEAE